MMSGGDDCFNPPPPLARWRMTDRSLKNPLYAVSIRPHRSRGGGSEHVTTNPPEDLFQSAPTARAVEDNGVLPSTHRTPCFNPPPPLARWRIISPARSRRLPICFNPPPPLA